VTCIDFDTDALAIDAEEARKRGCADRTTFLRADLLPIARQETRISVGQQHAIYGLGVCDYLTNEGIDLLLQWAHDHLVEGGWLLLTNRAAASPDRAFAEHILDWPGLHRTVDEIRQLVVKSPFGSEELSVEVEETGVNIVARTRRK
jgi:hypothetical protein